MKNIVIVGSGVLGSQIAFQTAYSGFNVTIYARSEQSIKKTEEKLKNLKKTYIDEIKKMSEQKSWSLGISTKKDFNKDKCLQKVEKAYENIKFEMDLTKVFKNSDLVIESIAEDLNEKKKFYKLIQNYLPSKTILVTNSSTLLPSKIAESTGRSDKFLALHFANSIWKNNTAEIMMQNKTNEKYFNQVIKFAEEINMIPLPIKKEKSGYLLNSMLVPFLFSGLDLYVNGISNVESIDKAWVLGTGAPKGPFQIIDIVGIKTAYNIVKMYTKIPSILAPYNFKGMEKLLKSFIDQGKLGISTKEGFYKYK